MKRLFLLSLVSFAFCFADGQALQLTRPTTGDVWPVFSVQRIQWQFANVDNIKIEVSADSARTWSVIQSSYPASATYYDWTVINKPSDSCFIRISDVLNPSVQSSNYPNNPFKIPKPTLNIDDVETSVYGKTVLPVSWSSTGTQNVSLFITYDNFQTYQLIAYNLLASTGFYNWAVKDTIASNAYILIQSVNNTALIDTITQPLSIKKLPVATLAKYRGGSYDGHSSGTNKAKSLRVLTPNTKVQLSANSIYPITWSSNSINLLTIKYSIDSGANWVNVATNVVASAVTYSWTVPATPSTRCLVKLQDASDSTVFDVSDSVFAIKTNTLDLISPAENEIIYKGQAAAITWTTSGISKINLSYFDAGVLKTIATGVTATNEVYNWTVPSIISDSIKIRISDYDDAAAIDTVSKVYVKNTPAATVAKYRGGSYDGHASSTNKAPSITLTQPNGNNQFASAFQYNITWTSMAIANVDIAFSSDSGRTWQNIITSYANSQSYLWTVPGVTSTKCLIRVRSAQDSTVSDMSDAVFTILPKQIDFTTDTTTVRYTGTAMPLEWTQQGIEKVSFNYKTTKNGSWQKIKDSVTSTLEVYNWIIPPVSADSVWIKIFDYKDSAVKDEQLFTGVFKALPAATSAKYKGGSFDGHAYKSTNNKISIYRPAANDTLISSSAYTISWRSGNVTDTVALQYSLDSGSTWVNIATAPALNQQYLWTVPSDVSAANTNVVSNRCIVRAINQSNSNELVGISNKTFSILQQQVNVLALCNGSSTFLTSNITATTYRWQVNTGNGFYDITNNTNYSGANTDRLQLNSIPSLWYGYQYRCIADGNSSFVFSLSFENTWTGAVSRAWEDGANWSCGFMPDANTDVVINTGMPIINSNTAVRSLKIKESASVTVSAGYTLAVMH